MHRLGNCEGKGRVCGTMGLQMTISIRVRGTASVPPGISPHPSVLRHSSVFIHPWFHPILTLPLPFKTSTRSLSKPVSQVPAKTKSIAKDTSTATIGFEAKLWLAADKLRNNMDAAKPSGARQITCQRDPKGEVDLVDCMVALPDQLFYSTQIPAPTSLCLAA